MRRALLATALLLAGCTSQPNLPLPAPTKAMWFEAVENAERVEACQAQE